MPAFGVHDEDRLSRIEQRAGEPDTGNPEPLGRGFAVCGLAHGDYFTPGAGSRPLDAANGQLVAVSGQLPLGLCAYILTDIAWYRVEGELK